jgi:MFS family permease
LFRFFLLYTTLYAGFGVASPFLPILLQTRGLRSEEIGLILALSTAVRLVSGPLAGRAADLTRMPFDAGPFAGVHGSLTCDRTPFARMLPSVIGSISSLRRLAAIRRL